VRSKATIPRKTPVGSSFQPDAIVFNGDGRAGGRNREWGSRARKVDRWHRDLGNGGRGADGNQRQGEGGDPQADGSDLADGSKCKACQRKKSQKLDSVAQNRDREVLHAPCFSQFAVVFFGYGNGLSPRSVHPKHASWPATRTTSSTRLPPWTVAQSRSGHDPPQSAMPEPHGAPCSSIGETWAQSPGTSLGAVTIMSTDREAQDSATSTATTTIKTPTVIVQAARTGDGGRPYRFIVAPLPVTSSFGPQKHAGLAGPTPKPKPVGHSSVMQTMIDAARGPHYYRTVSPTGTNSA